MIATLKSMISSAHAKHRLATLFTHDTTMVVKMAIEVFLIEIVSLISSKLEWASLR